MSKQPRRHGEIAPAALKADFKNESPRGYSGSDNFQSIRQQSRKRMTGAEKLAVAGSVAGGAVTLVGAGLTAYRMYQAWVKKNKGSVERGGTSTPSGPEFVQESRRSMKIGTKQISSGPDSERVVITDLCLNPSVPATTTGFNLIGPAPKLYPTNSSCFPNFYTQYTQWTKWRPKRLRMVYIHSVGTNNQGIICLAFNSGVDAITANPPSSTAQMLGYYGAKDGVVYKDLQADFVDASWKEGAWLQNDQSAAVDALTIACGQLLISTDLSASSGSILTLGNLFVEFEVEFCDRRKPYSGAGILLQFHQALPSIRPEDRERYLSFMLDKLRKELAESLKLQYSQPKRLTEFEKYLTREGRTGSD
jgi:hypothetical protein